MGKRNRGSQKAMLESLEESKDFDMIRKSKCRNEYEQNAQDCNIQSPRQNKEMQKLLDITPCKTLASIWEDVATTAK